MTFVKKALSSRKFVTSVAGALFVILNDCLGLGVSQEALNTSLMFLGTWIVGQGIVDTGLAIKGAYKPEEGKK